MGCLLPSVMVVGLLMAADNDSPMPVRYMGFGLTVLTLLCMVVLHALGRLDDD